MKPIDTKLRAILYLGLMASLGFLFNTFLTGLKNTDYLFGIPAAVTFFLPILFASALELFPRD